MSFVFQEVPVDDVPGGAVIKVFDSEDPGSMPTGEITLTREEIESVLDSFNLDILVEAVDADDAAGNVDGNTGNPQDSQQQNENREERDTSNQRSQSGGAGGSSGGAGGSGGGKGNRE